MDEKKVLEVLKLYIQKLSDLGIEPKEFSHDSRFATRGEALAHCHHMAIKVIKGMALTEDEEGFFSIGKAKRWLGFIQGVLWRDDIFTINDVRHHNHP